MRDSAKLVIWMLGTFMFVCFLSGVGILLFAPGRVSEAILTALIIAPVSNISGQLIGALAGTEKAKSDEPKGTPADPVSTKEVR